MQNMVLMDSNTDHGQKHGQREYCERCVIVNRHLVHFAEVVSNLDHCLC
jgi:hypothetical protein